MFLLSSVVMPPPPELLAAAGQILSVVILQKLNIQYLCFDLNNTKYAFDYSWLWLYPLHPLYPC
jgi:hypothetical protein